MKLLIKILSLFTLMVLISAENCSGPGVSKKEATIENQILDTYQGIENEFKKDELSNEDLNAFEKRAIQKLKDVADFINIYGDTLISLQFRKHTNQMIEENFLEMNDVKIFYKNLELLEDTLNVTIYYFKYRGLFKTEFDSIKIINHFKKESDFKYTGELQFTQRLTEIKSANANSTSNIQLLVEIVATKKRKQFGEKTEDVWEVFLGGTKL